MKFAERLKELRKGAGLTQEELGQMLGVTGANCTRYEKEQAQPKMATLMKMAQIFGVSVDYLLGVDEIAKQSEEGRAATAAYWSNIVQPEFKIEYRDGYFYLIALQDIALSLFDIKAGTDFKMNSVEFNIVTQRIEKSLNEERRKAALRYFGDSINFELLTPFVITALKNGATREEVSEKISALLSRHSSTPTEGE